jgi:hypothetical protein
MKGIAEMSLDMTMGPRVAAVHTGMVAQTETEPPVRFWLQDLVTVAGTTVCVALASVFGVLLYLS